MLVHMCIVSALLRTEDCWPAAAKVVGNMNLAMQQLPATKQHLLWVLSYLALTDLHSS